MKQTTKPTTVEITVISTLIDGKKMYISGLSKRSWDGKYIINRHTSDPNDADEFFDTAAADLKITRLVNHHGRTYQSETITVPVSRRHSLLEDDEMK